MFPWEVLITGVVGLAGIGGTLWQGKRAREAQTTNLQASLDAATKNLQLGISAENDRANKADKRRIYAAFQASVESMVRASVEDGQAASSEKQKETKQDLRKAEHHMYLMHSDLRLIAPDSVRTPALDVIVHFNDYVYAQGAWMEEFTRLQERSEDAMRADLGEPV